MKKGLLLILVLTILTTFPAVSFAITYDWNGCWLNNLYNNSSGVKGVASDFHVKQRHPSSEYYLTVIENGNTTGFAWQITDDNYWPTDRFDLAVHVKWPSGAEDYVPIDANLSQNTWHRLKIDYQGNNQWFCYVNNVHKATVVWSYYSGSSTKEKTQLEVIPYQGTEVYFYMGHAYNVWLKKADDSWVQQSDSWSCTPNKESKGGNGWANPFNNNIITANWDWEAKK